MSQILIMRHAKVRLDNPWITAKQMGEFIEQYNNAPVEVPYVTENLIQLVDNADIFLVSKLARSQETLYYLKKNPTMRSSLFNEAELPFGNGKIVKLPAMLWTIVFRVMWLFGYSKDCESYKEAKLRAKKATDKLLKYAKNNEKVILIGHGIINKLIAKVLISRGVTLVEQTGHTNLGYSIFEVTFD